MTASYIHTKHNSKFLPWLLRILALLYFIALGVAVIYLWGFTENRYLSTAQFKISAQDGSGASVGIMSLALPGLSDSGSMDSQVAIGYIASNDLLMELEKEFHLVEHYSAPKRDFIFRLDPKAPLEDRLEYYRSRIYAHFDKTTGLTEITVDTFKPELSREIAQTILKKAEAFMNVINQNIADQQLRFVTSEVERTSKQVEDVNNEMLKLQNEHNFISPDDVISASLRAAENLQNEYIKSEAELSTLMRDSPNSPRIESIRSQMRSLRELIDVENAKLSGTEKDRLNQLAVQFSQLKLKFDFATSLRAGAQTLLEKTRSSAIAQTRFFSVVQNPFLPEETGIPNRPYATATLIGLGILLFLIFRALAQSVFERA